MVKQLGYIQRIVNLLTDLVCKVPKYGVSMTTLMYFFNSIYDFHYMIPGCRYGCLLPDERL